MQHNQIEEMEAVEATGSQTNGDRTAVFTEDEKRLLELYDQLEVLQFEMALLRAQGVISQDPPTEGTEEDIQAAQQELLEAKAAYSLRSNIIGNVLMTTPILNAVHAGSNATIIEQDLLPLIEQRDKLSVALTELTSNVASVREELTKVESEHIMTSHKNVELAAKMLDLADEANVQKREDIIDPRTRQQLDDLEEAMKISHWRWRIMKGTVSATIVGSGIDWARDPKLLDIVLDNDDDEG